MPDPKKPDETIQGGAYVGADGNWHDANGKPLPRKVVATLEQKYGKPKNQSAEPVTAPEEPAAGETPSAE